MSLTISISNFRGIRSALMNASPIALLVGANEQGKSSIIDGLRSLLAGDKQPYGLTKDQLPKLLLNRDGNGNSMVCLRADDRVQQIEYPSGDIETQGTPFRATGWATGAHRFMALSPRDRARVLSEYLRAKPTEHELVEALEADDAIKATEEQQKALWKLIQERGWEGAWEAKKLAGTEAKGAWKQITKDQWGSKVGASWRPKGWTPEHEATTDETLKTELAAAEKALEDAIGKVAINDDERKKLEGLERTIPKLQEAVDAREEEGKRAKSAKDAAERQLKQVPILPPENWPACPHCHKHVQVLAGKNPGEAVLRAAPPAMSAADRKKIADDADNAERLLREASDKYDEAANAWRTARADLDTAEGAKQRLGNSDTNAMTAEQLQELRDEVTRCKSILAVKERIRAALLAHMTVMEVTAIADLLSPDGLRQQKMLARLNAFNERLAELSGIASWSTVSLGATDLGLHLNGVPYALCSGSGKYRCDAILQIALALQDGSEIVLLDEADILDGASRNGLFTLITWSQLHAVVGMMLTSIKTAPDLADMGWGGTWWIKDAEARPLADVKAKAA